MMDYGNRRIWQQRGTLLLAMVAGCCCGCWEEIRYESQPLASQTSQPSALPGDIAKIQPSAEQEQIPPTSDPPTASGLTTSVQPQKNSQQSSPIDGDPPAKPEAEMLVVTESHEETQPTETSSDDLLLEALFSPEMPATDLSGNDLADTSALSSTQSSAWRLGSYWSLGAAFYAKNASIESYQSRLKQAALAAEQLQVELPALPDLVSTDDRVAVIVAYLLDDRGPLLAKQIDQKFDSQHAALVQLATRSHVLLLVYSPRDKKRMLLVDQVEQSALASGLPKTVWSELVELLRRRAPYLEVKQAVFTLHEQVEAN